MEGSVEIEKFMQHLQANNLVIAPRSLVENRLDELKAEKLRKKYLQQKSLSMQEIASANIWGDGLSAKAVKEYAKIHAKENELFIVPKGKIKKYKLIRAAVVRIAKQRGQWQQD